MPTTQDEDQAPMRPTSDSRARSRSPRRSPPPPRKPKNFSGLKWKDSDRSRDDRDDRRRDRRDDDRPRDRDRDRDRHDRPRDSDRRRDDRLRDSDRRRDDRDRDRRGGGDRDRRPREDRKDREERKSTDKEKKPAAAPAPTAAPGETMIMVTVNDRLGTKAQIPCLASDPVKLFKAMVAAKIGRPVHEIMLKRQGQRPFHDSLTLADYEISNGVQIDLELNTGD